MEEAMSDAMRRFLRSFSIPACLTLSTLFSAPSLAQSRAAPPELTAHFSEAGGPRGLGDGWWRDHFALRLRGIEYRDSFVLGHQNLRLRLSGPIVKGSPGLRLDLRGWAWQGGSGRLSAYGSVKRQGFKFEIEF